MAKVKQPDEKKRRMIRFMAVCLAWAVWLFVMLSCVSFHASDPVRTLSLHPLHVSVHSGATAYIPDAGPRNWCGPVGATIAYLLLGQLGPGALVLVAMLAVALVYFTRGTVLPDWPIRLVGGALLIALVSGLFYVCGFGYPYATSPGGTLGVGFGQFLLNHFATVGTVVLLLAGLVVALLLVADEFMLALPAHMLTAWHRMPRREVAGAAMGAAGGMWGSLREVFEHLLPRTRMGAKTSSRAKKPKPSSASAAATTKEAAREETPSEIAPATEPVLAPAPPADAEMDDEDVDAGGAIPTPREPVIRKPQAPKQMPMPFKPQPANSPKQDLGNYRLPGLDLLDEAEPINPEGQEQRVREKARVLEQALDSFHIDGKVEAIDTGPVVTLFELGLAPGVKSSQVNALSKDIARALMSPPVRIIDNIPGKSTMGIEVPNLERERVRLKELFQLGSDQLAKMQLPMCLGKDASGNPLIEDLTRMPHMLIAGTTGSGKSVCINSIIMTLLLTQRPDHVKLIMVDPKMVEMQDYKSIPHLMAPIIDDMTKAESILEWATTKMDERYEIMAEASVRNIRDYNKLSKEQIAERFNAHTDDDKAKLVFHMPYIVIIIDELADLMMTSKDVEGHIVRIAQKARAVGIHLILATQRPEAQVVTGLIKSNMPGRICFQVRSRLDSRIMLDQSGGELLLGQGDMMMLRPTGGGLIRAQGAFVDDAEIKSVCKFLKEIAEPEFHPELMQLGAAGGLAEGEEKDPLYNNAVDIMIETGRGSVSLIQRRLNIGYSRASRIIDQMRRTGIVGAYKGSQASEVLVSVEEWEAMKASEAGVITNGLDEDGEPGATGSKTGMGQSAGYAQQFSSTFDGDEDDDGVPDEMPGEHRL